MTQTINALIDVWPQYLVQIATPVPSVTSVEGLLVVRSAVSLPDLSVEPLQPFAISQSHSELVGSKLPLSVIDEEVQVGDTSDAKSGCEIEQSEGTIVPGMTQLVGDKSAQLLIVEQEEATKGDLEDVITTEQSR